MRQLFAVALVIGLVAAPACGQRRGGGARGGFGGHVGFSSARGGFSGVSSGHFVGRAFAPRYGAGVRGGLGAPMGRLVRPGVSSARPAFYHNGWERRREGFAHRAPYGYAGPLGYAYYAPDYGWLDANDPGYDDDDDYGYADGSGVAADSYGEQAPENYVEQPDGYAQAQYGQPEVESPYEERAQVGAVRTPAVAPSLFDSSAVTLVFKDGRPSQKIHNYALTRTTLYVTDGRPREIPVAALDLAATEKMNRETGVSFRLPVAQ